MSWRLYKMAFRDLFNNRKKSILALFAILVGMIAFGTMLFSNELITNEILATHTEINPSSATLNVNKVDAQLIDLTENFDAIADYEVKSFHQMRGQDRKGNWKTVELFSAEDFGKISINKVVPMEGMKHPESGEMLIERDAKVVADKGLSDHLVIQLPNKQKKQLKITGVINDISVHPATMHNTIYAYVSPETLQSIGLAQNRIEIKLTGDAYDRDRIVSVSNEYLKLLEQNGYQIKNILIEDTPGVSMHLEEYKTALFLFRTFSFVALAFSCLIMSSLITSILSQLVKQMGILKSFGAETRQIVGAYLSMLFLPIAAASLVSLPLSQLLAQFVSERLLRISNISLTHSAVPIGFSILFLGLTLALPICIAYPSIAKGTKITIYQALYGSSLINQGLSSSFMKNMFTRPTRLSVRNAFRKKSRLVMNVLTLTISGICFITVLVAMLSVQSTLTKNLETFKYEYRFLTSSTGEKAVKETLKSMESIKRYERWSSASGKYLEKGTDQDKSYPIVALPKNSTFLQPEIMKGTWLSNTKANQIVVSHEFINQHPELQLGDKVPLTIQGKKANFTIGGIIKDLTGATIYLSQQTLDHFLPIKKQQYIYQTTINSDLKGRQRVKLLHQVEEKLLDNGISILQSETKNEAISILSSHFMPTFQTLLIVILMITIVSGFGLASTTNIQTLERVKEIGIMKSFGASKKQILKLIAAENLFITLVSWGASAILSLPAIFLAINYFSQVTLNAPIDLSPLYIVISTLLWLLMLLVISKRASNKPAKNAAKMSIKACLITE